MEAQMGKDAFRRRWDDYLKREFPQLMEMGNAAGNLHSSILPTIILEAGNMEIESLGLPIEDESAAKQINERGVQIAYLMKKAGNGEELTKKETAEYYEILGTELSETRQEMIGSDIKLERREDQTVKRLLEGDIGLGEAKIPTKEDLITGMLLNRLHLQVRLGKEKYAEYRELNRIVIDRYMKKALEENPPG